MLWASWGHYIQRLNVEPEPELPKGNVFLLSFSMLASLEVEDEKASRYKCWAKLAYALLLLMGIVATCHTVEVF